MNTRENGDRISSIAPPLDQATRRRRDVLAKLREMSRGEFRAAAVKAGIYTSDGKLSERYRLPGERSKA